MKYYSEKTKKFYEDEAACKEAEESFDKQLVAIETKKKELAEARGARAKEVEDAYKKLQEANKEYRELLEKFIKDYGSYHATYKGGDWPVSLFEFLFNMF